MALGFVFFVTSQLGLAGSPIPAGIGKIFGGTLFTMGLALVILTGADLFTSAMLTITTVLEGKVPAGRAMVHWIICYIMNFIGAAFVVLMVFLSGTPGMAKGGPGGRLW